MFPARPKLTAALLASLLFTCSLATAQLRISEFSATGTGAFLDADGEQSDWIELSNSGAGTVGLDGYFLTDDPTDLMKWRLPDVSLNAGSFLVVFASGKDRAIAGAELHTNFSLARGGEFLALVDPDGTSIVDQFDPGYPRQEAGFSYGRDSSADSGFFDPPTPGAANGAIAFAGLVGDTQFSFDAVNPERP